MNKSYIVIGDIHGCFDEFMALIKKFPKDIPIISCGDLIDRGPKSADVVKFIRDGNIRCVRGNHEQMAFTTEGHDHWLKAGGQATMDSYINLYGERTLEKWNDDIRWFNCLPIYLTLDDVMNDKGLKLLVSHTTIADFWNKRFSMTDAALWPRKSFPKAIEGYYNIYGHTPVIKPVIKDHFANIDTGAVYGGMLTAIQYPEMIIYQQENINEMPEEYAKYKP